MHYVDFDTAGGGIKKSLRSQDYCWDDHGFALVSKFFPTAAELLDNQFALTYNLTYNTFSDATNVNTEPIRQSVWYGGGQWAVLCRARCSLTVVLSQVLRAHLVWHSQR